MIWIYTFSIHYKPNRSENAPNVTFHSTGKQFLKVVADNLLIAHAS